MMTLISFRYSSHHFIVKSLLTGLCGFYTNDTIAAVLCPAACNISYHRGLPYCMRMVPEKNINQTQINKNINMKLKILVGSGRKIGLFTLPFLIAALILNLLFPSFFSVGGPSTALTFVSVIILIPGIIVWIWTVILILTKIPRKELITTGPYSIVKHPLYTGVALLVLP